MVNLQQMTNTGLPALPKRATSGHKGTFGKVALIGGSIGLSGSICLASLAALRSGSGLVTAAIPRSIQPIVAGYEASLMTFGLEDDPESGLLPQSETVVETLLKSRNAVGIGPGLGQGSAAVGLVAEILSMASCPVVVDADALNVTAEHRILFRPRACPCVATPHPGEFARLTQRSMDDVEKHRVELSLEFASQCGLVLVLKGAGTIVTDGSRIYVNTTGNSGMGTGGSGDVLTGMVTSLLGQGMQPLDAAILAVHVHGLAGDIAAERFTQRAMIASDLIGCLPEAWRRLEG